MECEGNNRRENVYGQTICSNYDQAIMHARKAMYILLLNNIVTWEQQWLSTKEKKNYK